MIKELLRLQNAYVSIDGQQLSNFNFTLFENEIVSILDSTGLTFEPLIRAATGNSELKSGSLFIDERALYPATPLSARQMGVYCVQSQLQQVPYLSVAENLFEIGRIKHKASLLNLRKAVQKTRALLDEFGLSTMSPQMIVASLPISDQYLLDILRFVVLEAKVLIIGDIFYKFAAQDMPLLIRILKKIAARGVSILLLSNRYQSAVKISNRLLLVRGNTVISNLYRPFPDSTTIRELLKGTTKFNLIVPELPDNNNVLLRLSHIKNGLDLYDVNLSVKKGEIVGIVDVSANHCGQSLIASLCGNQPVSGEIYYNNQVYSHKRAAYVKLPDIYLIPEPSINCIFENLNLMDNIVVRLPRNYRFPLVFINRNIDQYLYKNAISSLNCDSLMEIFGTDSMLPISVTKIQRLQIMFARVICAKARLIFLDSPFDNYDSVCIDEYNRLLNRVCKQGVSAVIVSSNHAALSQICSRLYTIADGSIS